MSVTTQPSPDVVVVGAGVVGCACASILAGEGLGVTVVEQDRVGAHASGGSAGIISAAHEGKGGFEQLALASRELYPGYAAALKDETGIDVEYQRDGVLTLVTEEAADAARSMVGDGERWLGPHEIRELEPELRGGWAGALLAAEDGQVNTGRLTSALAESAARRGARFLEGTTATGLIREGDRVTGVRTNLGRLAAGAVVIAAGPWSGLLGEAIGCSIPVFPVKGQLVWVRTRPRALHRPVFTPGGYLTPKYELGIALGATEEDAGFDERTTLSAAASLIRMGIQACPALSHGEFMRSWAGLRPGSADGLPVLGPVPGWPGLILATGHFRNGVLLSLISGELVRDWVLGRPVPLPIESFSPARFSRS